MQTKLWELRRNKNLLQKDVADALGMSVTTYSQKEQGKIEFKATEMFKASEFFGVPMDQIFLPRSHQNGN